MATSGAFGVLRALRLVSAVPCMRRVVSALLGALPGMASIAALLGLILCVAAVVVSKLFTLFQVMTGEAWSEVAREVMDEQPMAWIFFILYIAVTTYTVLNLVIAVAVSAWKRRSPTSGSTAVTTTGPCSTCCWRRSRTSAPKSAGCTNPPEPRSDRRFEGGLRASIAYGRLSFAVRPPSTVQI
ncbi:MULTISPECIES: ion transporter [unclassified Saccharopolyspora]|uniref:ion transporter n=1 Tax=unclassified Saccharopolyspora TaxID=2646250 RepID=UPI002103AE4B|nr:MULTISPECIES: ion transporter [unclassified Saccharopolyspora]